MRGITLFFTFLLPVLISIKIAKDRRKSCTWTLQATTIQMIVAGLMIVPSEVVEFVRAEPGPLVVIGSKLLGWYGVYRLARAIYRRSDLKAVKAAADPTEMERLTGITEEAMERRDRLAQKGVFSPSLRDTLRRIFPTLLGRDK